MKNFNVLPFMFLSLTFCSAPTLKAPSSGGNTPPPKPATLSEAIASAYRTPENVARDTYRHPLATLTMFGLKSDQNVIEIAPGQGWYSEILAPFLAGEGHYTEASPATPNEKLAAFRKVHPELVINHVDFAPPKLVKLGPDGSADLVLTFRNLHGWLKNGSAPEVLRAAFSVLKKGGVLGIVDHRAEKSKARIDSGYISEREVIRLAERAGFKLAEKSEINANAKDTKNYPEGVWTLPPTLRLKEQDRARYLAIGESDRMTLKFSKP